jgi:hypothetical protein
MDFSNALSLLFGHENDENINSILTGPFDGGRFAP